MMGKSPLFQRVPSARTSSLESGDLRYGQIMYVTKTKDCQRCHETVNAILVRNITMSGISQVYWWCLAGSHPIAKPATQWISHEKIKKAKINIDDLPVIRSYLGSEVCARCGALNVELHHWAPRHLFDDAWDWPTNYLCKEHHALWHKLVTPNMTEVRNERL